MTGRHRARSAFGDDVEAMAAVLADHPGQTTYVLGTHLPAPPAEPGGALFAEDRPRPDATGRAFRALRELARQRRAWCDRDSGTSWRWYPVR